MIFCSRMTESNQWNGNNGVNIYCWLSSFRLSSCKREIDSLWNYGTVVRYDLQGASFYTRTFAWKDDRYPDYYLSPDLKAINDLDKRFSARVYYLNRQKRRISDNSFGLPNIWECYQQLHGDRITLCVWQRN